MKKERNKTTDKQTKRLILSIINFGLIIFVCQMLAAITDRHHVAGNTRNNCCYTSTTYVHEIGPTGSGSFGKDCAESERGAADRFNNDDDDGDDDDDEEKTLKKITQTQ